MATPICRNHEFIEKTQLACDAIKALSAQGFDVLNVSLEPVRPAITVRYDGRCRRLIERGEAIHFRFGRSDAGAYRNGAFHQNGCRVIWTEHEARYGAN